MAKKPRQSVLRAQRLRRLRQHLDPTQAAFCRRVGFSKSRWANYEAGRGVSQAGALQLVAKIPGLSLDWIFAGDDAGLSLALARELSVEPPPPQRKSVSRQG